MALALRAWAINQGEKNSVRNLRYGPRTRLVRGIYTHSPESSCVPRKNKWPVWHRIIYLISRESVAEKVCNL